MKDQEHKDNDFSDIAYFVWGGFLAGFISMLAMVYLRVPRPGVDIISVVAWLLGGFAGRALHLKK